MLKYVIRRSLMMIPTILGISLVAFLVISLPPGSYLDAYVAGLAATGEDVDQATIDNLEQRYGLDKPVPLQYVMWMKGIVLRGDFGESFDWGKPVTSLIWQRLSLTFAISIFTLLLTWVIAFPIGIYSAVKQYTIGDYIATLFGFVGLAIPSFLLALILMFMSFKFLNTDIGGLFSTEYQEAPWSWAKVVDLLKHLWIPAIILGTGGTAGLIRTIRANLLDELHKPYVKTARAKGLSELRLLFKYPLRVALNPFFSTVGWSLRYLVSGSTIISVVLNLPTTGPLLLRALMAQDMYLAGTFILMLSVMTVFGTLISDIILGLVDPRIRFGEEAV
jgi:peptide/nickel transport system permease protein